MTYNTHSEFKQNHIIHISSKSLRCNFTNIVLILKFSCYSHPLQ